MIKELMLISTILYGNALPTFNNDLERVVKPISSTANNVSLGSISFVVDDTYLGLNNETLTFNASSLDFGFLYDDNYNLFYRFIMRSGYSVGGNSITCNNYIRLDYDSHKYLIDNVVGLDFDIDVGNIDVINSTTLRIMYNVKLSIYTPSGENFTYYDFYGNHTQTMQLRNVQGNYIDYSISNINVVNFSAYHDRLYIGDITDIIYDSGYDSGYDDGYDSGYDDGFTLGNMDFNPTNWLIDAVSGFMSFEIFPNFSIGGLLLTVTGALITLYIMKLLLGG